MKEMPEVIAEFPEVPRISTKLYSLDRALGAKDRPGICLRAMYEIYGREHVGKSTLALYLASIIRKDGSIAFCDLEYVLDLERTRDVLKHAGFLGTLQVVPDHDKKGLRSHADIATDAENMLRKDEYNAIIVDSVGMWVSRSEAKGEIGEANVGRRAFEVGQWVRRCSGILRESKKDKAVFLVNHSLPIIGGRGHYTPGGRAKQFSSNARMYMYRKDSSYAGGCFQAEIKIEKLRYGGTHRERKAQVFIVPQFGVSVGMTALLDCIRYEHVERNRQGYIKYEGETLGRIGEFVEAASNGDTEAFEFFLELLFGDAEGR